MKIEPKFRGKSAETNEWVYGCGWYHIDYTEEHKKENNMSERANLLTKSGFVECHLDSMDRYTELKDKNSVEIFEGDILLDEHCDVYGVVTFEEGKFLCETETYSDDLWEACDYMVVVGNIYNNPELIE